MEHYADIDNDSGVIGYDIGTDFIRVYFSTSAIYLYTYSSAGPSNIENMKSLAISGEGLNSYINKYVKKGYSRKEA